MIRGVHTMFYTSDPEGLRVFLRDTLGFKGTDVGDGWLIFDLPEADMGCHPTDGVSEPPSGTASISLYCDDIHQTVQELTEKGVEFAGEVRDEGFGLVTFIKAPGDFWIQLFQPSYQK